MSTKSTIEIKEKTIGLGARSNLLPPDTVLEQVTFRIQQLSNLLIEKKAELKNAPEGSLRIAQSGKRVQYYHKIDDENPQGKYLHRDQDNLAFELAQKDYNERLIKEIEHEVDALNKLVKNYQPKKLQKIYDDMHKNRKHLINPSIVSDENFAVAWENFDYEGLEAPEEANYITQKGEVVRSKSQVLIANCLNQMEVPYRFEFPMLLKSEKGFSKSTLIYPDFYCLNVRTRKEYIWEHFEKMEDSESASCAIGTIAQYQANGFIPGKEVITTMETASCQIDEKQILNIIEKFLK